MSLNLAEAFSGPPNPLDHIEEILISREWAYHRSSEDELLVDVSARWTEYRLHFLWREDLSVLHFSILFDIRVPETRKQAIYELLTRINQKLWLGHFDLVPDTEIPTYRHSIPFRGTIRVSPEQIEDLVELGLEECERFFPAFQMVVWGGKSPQEALEVALFETEGEA